MNREMTKKFLILLLVIVLAPLVGGLYGILNDQLTYTISPEYYTKFKFEQFGFVDLYLVNEVNTRILVSAVGFFATWWVGLPIGIILGLVGLIHKNSKQMFLVSLRAIFVTIIVALITGLIGLTYGKFYLANIGVDWWLPDNLIDTKNFIAVGSMHNFSYLGGLTGVIAGIIYSVRQKRKYETTTPKIDTEQLCADFQKVKAILETIKSYTVKDTDVIWAGYDNVDDFLTELNEYIEQMNSCDFDALGKLELNFVPTSSYQELSISNGWGDYFLKLANQFDTLAEKLKKHKNKV
jgi:hypothetical protein